MSADKPVSELEAYALIQKLVESMTEIDPQDKEDFIQDCYVAVYSCFSVGGNKSLVTESFVMKTIKRLAGLKTLEYEYAPKMVSLEHLTRKVASKPAGDGWAEAFSHTLTESQLNILQVKMDHPDWSLQKIGDQFGCSRQYVKIVLDAIKKKYFEYMKN